MSDIDHIWGNVYRVGGAKRPVVPLWFALLCELQSHKRGFRQPSDDAIRRMFPELNPTERDPA